MATTKSGPSGDAAEQTPEEDTQERAADLAALIAQLDRATGDGRMLNAMRMLKSGRSPLFAEADDDRLTGVVTGQTEPSPLFACMIDRSGGYMCCTHNLHVCGGLRGKPCKHLLVVMLWLVQSGRADAKVLSEWARRAAGKKPQLDRDAMAATLHQYRGASGGDRPRLQRPKPHGTGS